MSNSKNNDTKVGTAQPKPSSAPDGKSQFPTSLVDFPTPTTGGGGDGGPSGPMPQ